MTETTAQPLTRDDVKAVANEQIVKWHELGGSLLGLKSGDAGLEIANRLHDEGFRSASIEVKRSKVVVELEKSEGLDKFSADREALGNLGQGGVVHNSSPSTDDAGAHSVGDGPGAGDASATPATWVTEGKLAKRLHDSVVRKSEALGRVEKIERRLCDAREDLAHAESEQREASAAYDAFIAGGAA
ncbi:hypothetical protein R3Q06_27610 [Rhodococcus erythropolis]|uniref:hypothetical protein n=1 Tax=Rhodococcus erythropolis TaxID=1833 RepID=UPI0029493957|nr:hypothetical protein [Rhodococcus erythropolis]MDV6277268.1 hypothetical protein [Rhodococcus erythropolis]